MVIMTVSPIIARRSRERRMPKSKLRLQAKLAPYLSCFACGKKFEVPMLTKNIGIDLELKVSKEEAKEE